MGINNNEGTGDVAFISTDNVAEVFNKYITKQLVVQGDQATENDLAYLIDIKKESTKAKSDDYQRRLPLFMGQKDGSELYIMPVRGKGLWDAIWGFVAVDKEMIIQGVYFDHKGETPGLGAEITQKWFQDRFVGKKIKDASGKIEGVKVVKANATPNDVDAISGATITSNGVSAMVAERLAHYQNYFDKQK